MSKKITLALVMLTVLAASVLAQSLADVARKEEERRKASPPPTKVYTNKDLVEVAGAPAPPPPATPSDSAAVVDKQIADLKGDDKDAKDVKGQPYWAGRQKALQDTLDRDTAFASALQSQINALTTDFVNRDDPAQRAVIEKNRVKALGELNQLKTTLVADQKALTDFQEEARRAGVPPGWLR